VDRDRLLEQEDEEHDRDSRRRRIRQVRRICQFVPINRKSIRITFGVNVFRNGANICKEIHESCTERISAERFSWNLLVTPAQKLVELLINDAHLRGADPCPLPLLVAKTGRNHLNEEITP
jgi:hypothetical protein